MRIPRELDPVEVRVLGALLEKEQTTPEYYPLTLNALRAAANQKSNRQPVMELTDADIRDALERLHEDVLVWPTRGARSERWRQNLDRRWQLDAAAKAVMTLLMVRGPQTPGELRTRAERVHPFPSPAAVEEVLEQLAAGAEPLVTQLARRRGQKEARWSHLLSGEPQEEEELLTAEAPPAPARTALGDRVDRLEKRLTVLEEEVARLGRLLE